MALKLCLLLSILETLVISQKTTLFSSHIVTFIVLFGVQSCAVFFYNIFIYPSYFSPLRHLPGPKDGNILLGQAINLLAAESPNDYPLKWMHQHPDAPLIRYTVAGSEWLVVNSVQASREILHTFCYSFKKPNWFRRIIGEIAGVGLVNADGDVHKAHRRVLNGAFTLSNYRKMLPVFYEKASEFSSAIEKAVKQSPKESVEVSKLLSQTTLDIIGKASLGVDLGSLSTESSTFHHLYDQLLNLPPIGAIVFLLNIFFPVRPWIPLKANRDFMHASSEVRRLLLETIRKRKTEVFANGNVRSDFAEEGEGQDYLTFMIREKGVGKDKWSDEEILGHLMNFMSAGHETTAGALVWAILSMCLHPDIQARLRSEIRQHIPHKIPPTYEELDKLQYMNNFLKEVLRCFPPSTRIPRASTHPITLNSKPDLLIPVGTSLTIHPAVLSFNPTIWGPDAHLFNPDRHDPKHPSAKDYPESRDPYALASFSNGARICIGRGFAMLEMKSILVELLRSWEMKRGWGKDGEKLDLGVELDGVAVDVPQHADDLPEKQLFGGVKPQNFISLRPRDGLWVRFAKLE